MSELQRLVSDAASRIARQKRDLEALLGVRLVVDAMRREGDELRVTFRAERESDRFAGCGDPSCCGVRFDPERHYVAADGLIYRK